MKQELQPQITLCIPIMNEAASLEEVVQNISSYFNKFLIPFEIIFCLDPSLDQSLRLVSELERKYSFVHGLINPKHLGRGASLKKALMAAKSPFIAAASADLSVPLGDLTKLLQNLVEHNATIAFGSRVEKKDSPFWKISNRKSRLEITFMNILRESRKMKFKDPFCSAFVLKIEARDLLLGDLELSGWYLTPHLQQRTIDKGIPSVEIPVHATLGTAKDYPYYREYLRLLLWSLRKQRTQ